METFWTQRLKLIADRIAAIIDANYDINTPGESIRDFLTDLRHFCDSRGIPFDCCNADARTLYAEEIAVAWSAKEYDDPLFFGPEQP